MAVAMRTKLIVFIIVMGLGTLGAFGWIGYQLFATGFSAKTEPHALEVLVARQIRHLAIPLEQRNAQNPDPVEPRRHQGVAGTFRRPLRDLSCQRR